MNHLDKDVELGITIDSQVHDAIVDCALERFELVVQALAATHHLLELGQGSKSTGVVVLEERIGGGGCRCTRVRVRVRGVATLGDEGVAAQLELIERHDLDHDARALNLPLDALLLELFVVLDQVRHQRLGHRWDCLHCALGIAASIHQHVRTVRTATSVLTSKIGDATRMNVRVVELEPLAIESIVE